MCHKYNLSKTSLFVPVKVHVKTVMDGSSLLNILAAVHYNCACNLKKIAL